MTPTVALAIFAVKDLTVTLATGFAFSSLWPKESPDMGEVLNTLREGDDEEIAALGHTGLGAAALGMEEEQTMKLLDILAENMETPTIFSSVFDGN